MNSAEGTVSLSKIFSFLFPALKAEFFLNYFFLLLLLVVFFGGVYLAFKGRDYLKIKFQQLSTEYERVSGQVDPEDFLDAYLKDLNKYEYYLQIIPNILIGIGILATFLGLGLVMEQAAVVLHGANAIGTDFNKVLVGLRSVVSLIAFKFQTSVWGLGLSIIFQLYFQPYYFTFKEKGEQEFSLSVYGNEKIATAKQLAKEQSKRLVNLGRFAGELEKAVFEVKESTGRFGETALSFKNTVDIFERSVNNSNAVLLETVNTVCDKLKEMAEMQSTDIVGLIQEQLLKMQEANQILFTEQQKMITGLPLALSELQTRIGKSLDAINNQLGASISRLDRDVAMAINSTISKLESSITLSGSQQTKILTGLQVGIKEGVSFIEENLKGTDKSLSQLVQRYEMAALAVTMGQEKVLQELRFIRKGLGG